MAEPKTSAEAHPKKIKDNRLIQIKNLSGYMLMFVKWLALLEEIYFLTSSWLSRNKFCPKKTFFKWRGHT